MKKFYFFIVLYLPLTFNTEVWSNTTNNEVSCGAETNTSSHLPEMFIYGADKKKTYTLKQTDDAIQDLLRVSEDHKGPILIYVHGRALGLIPGYDQEPGESEKDYLPKLRTYSSQIMMYHWPHHGTATSYPEDDARLAGRDFACVLRKLDAAITEQGELKAPLFLITHSMGSIVLEESVQAANKIDLSKFHTVAIFSSASRIVDSATWLAKIKSQMRYVLASEHDPILEKLKKFKELKSLGLCGSDCLRESPLAAEMIYIDISPLGKAGHAYFANGKADAIVSSILKGETPVNLKQGFAPNIFLAKKK